MIAEVGSIRRSAAAGSRRRWRRPTPAGRRSARQEEADEHVEDVRRVGEHAEPRSARPAPPGLSGGWRVPSKPEGGLERSLRQRHQEPDLEHQEQDERHADPGRQRPRSAGSGREARMKNRDRQHRGHDEPRASVATTKMIGGKQHRQHATQGRAVDEWASRSRRAGAQIGDEGGSWTRPPTGSDPIEREEARSRSLRRPSPMPIRRLSAITTSAERKPGIAATASSTCPDGRPWRSAGPGHLLAHSQASTRGPPSRSVQPGSRPSPSAPYAARWRREPCRERVAGLEVSSNAPRAMNSCHQSVPRTFSNSST